MGQDGETVTVSGRHKDGTLRGDARAVGRRQARPASNTSPRCLLQIAIEGCCHGELDNIYGALQHLERVEGKKIDLLISCGDFQVRREQRAQHPY